MVDEPTFKMSQDYEIVPPRKQRAYPILVEEWLHLKEKVRQIRDDANFYHTLGSVLLGVAGSALLTALTLDIPKVEGVTATPMPILIAWFAFFSTAVCGGLAMYFGKSQREVQHSNAIEVISHMELIEKRYGSGET
jgi:hypothetical protein